MWPAMVIAKKLHEFGYGKDVSPLLERIEVIRKSATAGWGNRPTVQEHYETLAVNARQIGLFQPDKFTLIDDVITKGSTVFACAKHLHESFPEAKIQAFALIRTQGLVTNIGTLVEPATGTISYDKNYDSGNRDP